MHIVFPLLVKLRGMLSSNPAANYRVLHARLTRIPGFEAASLMLVHAAVRWLRRGLPLLAPSELVSFLEDPCDAGRHQGLRVADGGSVVLPEPGGPQEAAHEVVAFGGRHCDTACHQRPERAASLGARGGQRVLRSATKR